MDFSMPTLLNQTIPRYSSESDSNQRYPASPTTPTPSRGHSLLLQAKLIQASERVTQLKVQLRERAYSLTDALKEVTCTHYTLTTATLARRVEDLERMCETRWIGIDVHMSRLPQWPRPPWQPLLVGGDAERVNAEFEEKLQATEKERGNTKELVSEIKKLVVKN